MPSWGSQPATQAELKAAYRRLVKRHHPDAGGDPERILALNAAWELLGNAERRRQFDRQSAVGIGRPRRKGWLRPAAARLAMPGPVGGPCSQWSGCCC